MRVLIAFFTSLLFSLLPTVGFAQTDAHTDIVVVDIDGITRTLTITFTLTDVVSVDVAPASDKFDSRARMWLDGFWMVANELSPGSDTDTESVGRRFDTFFDATETVPYPKHYIPFVRQYRFAIHSCRALLRFYEFANSEENDHLGVVSIGIYYTLFSACYEQYQDAYVELERISLDSHPVTSLSTATSLPTDNLGIVYRLDKDSAEVPFIIENEQDSNGLLVLRVNAQTEAQRIILTFQAYDEDKPLGAWTMLGLDTADPAIYRFRLETDIPVDEIDYYSLQFDIQG